MKKKAKFVLELEVDGEKVREFKIRLAHGDPAYCFFMETKEFRGKRATLSTLRITDKELDSFFAIRVDSTFPGEDEVYTEKCVPNCTSLQGGVGTMIRTV